MPPAKHKTWEVVPNINNGFDVNDATTSAKREALLIKDTFIGFSNNPWVVESSCDSLAAGNNDQVDRWIDTGDIVNNFAGSIHSWYVLKDPISGQQYCFDMNVHTTAPYRATVTWSPSIGFGVANGGADGTTTARPTATDEIDILSGLDFGSSSSGTKAAVIHAWRSTDGECTRMVFIVAGVVRSFWAFETPRDPISAWSPAVLALTYRQATADATGYAFMCNSSVWNFRQTAVAAGTFYLATPGTTTVRAGESDVARLPHGANGELGMYPASMVSNSASLRGLWGNLYDFYFGPDNIRTGTMIRDSSGPVWGYCADVWFPWDPTLDDMVVS